MRPILLLLLVISLSAHAQAVRPAPVSVPRPPVHTPGYFPGTPPEPTYTPNGAGLPGERIPGTVAPSVPRSKGRVLPREPDGAPGLWAADGDPRGARASVAELFGVEIPYPEHASDEAKRIVRACAADIKMASHRAQQTQYVAGLPLNVRQCLAAAAYGACARDRRDKRAPTTGARSTLPPDEQELIAEAVAHAIELRTRYCSGVQISDAAKAALERVLDAWMPHRNKTIPTLD